MNTHLIKGALAAVALALLSSTPARAQVYANYPDGTILIHQVNFGGSIIDVRHVIHGGAKFRIGVGEESYFTSPHTYNVSESEVEAITNSPRDGTVLQARGDHAVYVIFGGRKWHIPDAQELEYYGGVGAIRTVPESTFVSWMYLTRPGTLVREHNTAAVYVIFGNARFWVPTEADVFYYGGWIEVRDVPAGSMSSMKTKPDCGTRLRERSSGVIYIFNAAGQKSVIQNPADYDWANLRVVPDGTLAAYPDGSFFCMN
ncbi:hypothetical protein [Archangium lipolyticum]|uniref:hypothetical protein n=1 Tax=Archangium lipolyticum TaxID=2970465 RepID=UPI002149FA55|nr:hypothetical protein [Archangium lipolyticum]